jgi:hypothetical protein
MVQQDGGKTLAHVPVDDQITNRRRWPQDCTRISA